jgi:hypothetical protein
MSHQYRVLIEVALVLVASVLILAVSGIFSSGGLNGVADIFGLFYFPTYLVAVQFFGGAHSASELGIKSAFAIAVFTQNVLLWYLTWRVRRRAVELRDT